MPEIRILPDHVANQIAAGEVVERPAAVVKELLENSLDAGATRVSVEFRNGGKGLIVVEDNGCGMSPDQALLALEPHATSKIRTAGDLNSIGTFGFRGEAVPSIASVARFTLRTRRQDDVAGTEIFVNAGKLVHQKETGMAPGTRIEVANLFHPVPARLKFLKTENTEAAHITRLVRLYAVAQPQVGFSLSEDGKEIFRSPASVTLLDRVREIWGRQLSDDLTAFEPVEAGGMCVSGLLGKPGIGRSTRQEMVTIVNGRPVDSRTLAYALTESYHTLVPKGRFPPAFLFVEIDPHFVDVNVHPAKREIRFRDEAGVRRFVISAVLEHLKKSAGGILPAATGSDNFRPTPEDVEQPAAKNFSDSGSGSGDNSGDDFDNNFDKNFNKKNNSGNATYPENNYAPTVSDARDSGGKTQAPATFKLDWRLVGRLRDGLFVFETGQGFVVLNFRAALERIWYERILQRFEKHESSARQLLLFPVPLEFEPLAANTLREKLEMLNVAGFEIEEFGRNFFRVASVPDWLPEAETEIFVRDLVAEIGRRPGEFQREHLAHSALAKMASSRAGSAGNAGGDISVSDEIVTGTVKDLFRCAQPTVCPKGKPVFFELSRAELSRRFGG